MPDLLTALGQTAAARSARITALTDHTWPLPPRPAREDRGAVAAATLALGRTAVGAAGRGVLRSVSRGADPRHPVGQGVLDLAGRRSMLDYGSYAVLQVGTQEWSGRSGRPLHTLPTAVPRVASPLWLVDLVHGVTTATDQGTDEVDGRGRRHLRVTADLARASSRQPEGCPRQPGAGTRTCWSSRSTCGWTTAASDGSVSSTNTGPTP